MFRTSRLIPVFLTAIAAISQAATLQQLSMDQMSRSATAVVRARLVNSSVTVSGSTTYTHYKLSVSEVWKGVAPVDVVLPGGSLNGRTQSFPGVPEVSAGTEYILFLWTAPSTGLTHLVGLTQGLFEIAPQADGSALAARRESGELMLDSQGRRVSDQAVSMKLTEMKARVRQALSPEGAR